MSLATVIRRHHWQTAGRCLEKGQTKRFRESGVHKQAALMSGPAVERRDLSALVLFRISHQP